MAIPNAGMGAFALMWLPAAANAGHPLTQLVSPLGAVILALQCAPLIHLLSTSRLCQCNRTSCCIMYVLILSLAWMIAIMALDAVGNLLPSLLVLAAPFAYWLYALNHGPTAGRGSVSGEVCDIR